MSLKVFHFSFVVVMLTMGVFSLTKGDYAFATWDFGWAGMNLYLGINAKEA